jgi:hypothetical protein
MLKSVTNAKCRYKFKGKTLEKNLLENLGTEEDIIKNYLQEKRCDGNWIHLTRNILK